MKTIIINYNAGNTQSVLYALERQGISAVVTDEIELIQSADKLILPGVGEASSAMSYLKQKKLDLVIQNLKQPILGICLGMQLMCEHSDEGNTDCMGIFKQKVKLFPHSKNLVGDKIKIPQMGWNNIFNLKGELMQGINDQSFCYFVHSYYAELGENTISTTNYGIDYSSALQKNNFYATQFHPEKSSSVGEQILFNFLKL